MTKETKIYKTLETFMHEIQVRERKKFFLAIWGMYTFGMIVGYLVAQIQ